MRYGFYRLLPVSGLVIGGLALALGVPVLASIILGGYVGLLLWSWVRDRSRTPGKTPPDGEDPFSRRIHIGGRARTISASPKEMRAMPYTEYLQTPHWKQLRKEKLLSAGYRCQMCNSGSGPFEVHHNTYERLGEELDRDLIVLCRACHGTFHDHRDLSR